MGIRVNFQRTSIVVTALCCFALPASGRAQVVNVDATKYGFGAPTDPAPTVGQHIAPFGPNGVLNQLTLAAGTYNITNATGLAGADANFTAWRFNGDNNWVWSIVIANDASDNVVFYGDAGGIRNSQAAIASDAGVQNFFGTFTLPTTTTLDFMIRDYYTPDNAGGVAVNIQAVTTTPEPSSMGLIGAGLAGLIPIVRRRTR